MSDFPWGLATCWGKNESILLECRRGLSDWSLLLLSRLLYVAGLLLAYLLLRPGLQQEILIAEKVVEGLGVQHKVLDYGCWSSGLLKETFDNL